MTKADVARVAAKYVDPKQMVILIVGDRAKIEADLKTLPYAQVVNVLDPEGNPIPTGLSPAAPSGTRTIE